VKVIKPSVEIIDVFDGLDVIRKLEPCCVKCGHYEEIETASAVDGKYVIVAIKIDKPACFSEG